jgi:hypothetical protein
MYVRGIMFDAISKKCTEYYNQIPSDTFSKMGRSAIYSFSATYLFIRPTTKNYPDNFNLSICLVSAGLAALASLIYALTNPLFNMIFGDNRHLVHREFMKWFVNIGISTILFQYATAAKVNLLSVYLLINIPSNLFLSAFESIVVFIEWCGDQNEANRMRQAFRSFGLYPEPGSSSSFINFGRFPFAG